MTVTLSPIIDRFHTKLKKKLNYTIRMGNRDYSGGNDFHSGNIFGARN